MTQAKNKHHSQVIKNRKGQISVFFGVTLVAIFSFIAFVVNVGLFVKAKINMQNAVDSAAWSGAAAQARQLSNIAYLNWEMRNTYKEWMFKYYVLGQLANENTHETTGGNQMNFALKRFDETGAGFSSGIQGDHYNIPSICLHFGSENNENLCTIYQIPGLPRFHVAGIPDVSEEFEATMSAFVDLKAKNCMVRSTYNFSAAKNYAFAAGVSQNDIPIAAADRTGSWIQSMELALRMRNLEMIVNRPPVTEGICGGGGAPGCLNPEVLNNENQSMGIPMNDRPLKAYMAAMKNISGGVFKNNTAFANTFVLYELAPDTYNPSPQSLSNFLIPNDASYTNGETVVSAKRYLDLIPMVMNFSTFFTTFAPTTEALSTLGVSDSSGTAAEASCASTKTAFPVPGYILGFYKNPRVVTYYAVKAKAQYTGLLNPFGKPIEMAAYAAAKPFGGRIGPALVAPGSEYSESSYNIPRSDNSGGSRSTDYIMGFSTTNDPRLEDGAKVQGLPLPASNDFFLDVSSSDIAIGGVPSNVDTKFTLPNMIYNLNSETTNDGRLQNLPYNTDLNSPAPVTAGLFTRQQYEDLRRNIPNYTGMQAGVSAQDLIESYKNVRSPTNYDFLNYMVPTLLELETDDDAEHYSTHRYFNRDNETIGYFAPLFHANLLFKDQSNVKGVLYSYIEGLKDSVIVYRKALQAYAQKVRETPAQEADAYVAASKAIFNEDTDGDPSDVSTGTIGGPFGNCQKQSIASRFSYFILGEDQPPSEDNCNTAPLITTIGEYLNNFRGSSSLFYITSYRQNNNAQGPTPLLNNNLMRTGYSPGKDYGSENNGRSSNPLSGRDRNQRRNAYSTKLISLDSISSTDVGYGNNVSNYLESQRGFSPEGETPRTPEDIKTGADTIYNLLPREQLSEFGSDLFF
ncbi:Tad domain-containing protein [Halobacteriovorax sp. Y22]|uniref:Tad domain-containing protein n=1 Tax=Halobacteriovorax sp. Y22 TaxID=2505978 RepID=UPI0010819BC0|nr:Tad domain-containing protein [Halobacteriovorax sp. Y22]TGD45814.1 hypothetical protein EP118_14415 [Halobacteriovorax sp. Y22]